MRARARHTGRAPHQPGKMNRTEAAYAQTLNMRIKAGEVTHWEFEAIKFRLADKCFYTPDFAVFRSDGEVEIHEVKGHWEDDARVKIKCFADRYPFRTFAIQKKKGQWHTEEIKTV